MLERYYQQNGWDKKISYEKLKDVESFLETIPNLRYLGHGGTCISLISGSDPESSKYVLKIIEC